MSARLTQQIFANSFLNNFQMRSCFSLGEDEDSDAAPQDPSGRDSEDEAEWDRLQADVKGRDPILDPKSKESHIVHAPYFPEVRTDLTVVVLLEFNIFLTSFVYVVSTGKARVVVDICHGSQENRAYNTASTDIQPKRRRKGRV